jgi:hypothetical protein
MTYSTFHSQSDSLLDPWNVCTCARVRARARETVRLCESVRACVCVCVCLCMYVLLSRPTMHMYFYTMQHSYYTLDIIYVLDSTALSYYILYFGKDM